MESILYAYVVSDWTQKPVHVEPTYRAHDEQRQTNQARGWLYVAPGAPADSNYVRDILQHTKYLPDGFLREIDRHHLIKMTT